jgi:uncharacterized membrane protein YhhN
VRRVGPGLLLAVLGTAAALFYLGSGDDGSARLMVKPLPVLALAGWVVLRGRPPRERLTAAGLLLAAVGDVLLDLGRFLPGLAAFLLTHVLYILAFLSVERRPALARALPFAAWGLVTFDLLRPGLGTLALPVGSYVVVITAMMWRASACVGSPHTGRAAWLGLAGAVGFGASDTLIAVTRFLQPIEGGRVPIMLLYWLGQWGIAASAALGGARSPRTG